MSPEGRKAFHEQRRSAKRRGIDFLFTEEEWWAWWQVDNRWARRGRTKGCLMMARHGDIGPYAAWNVYAATHSQNVRDALPHRNYVPPPPERRGRPHLGRRGDLHPCSKAVITPKGRFGSAALAAEAFSVNPATITAKARRGTRGWSYLD